MLIVVLFLLAVSLPVCNAFHASHHFRPSRLVVNGYELDTKLLKVLAGFQGRLNDGYLEKIDLVKDDFKKLSSITNRNEDEAKRYKQCKVILDCIDALTSIDNDLKMFSEHLEGDDESLKSTAKVFMKEFTECKEQIIGQLNKLL